MRYFIDTEYDFVTSKTWGTVLPISVGIVAEDEREFYRVNLGAVRSKDMIEQLSPFVREQVVPVLHATGIDGRSVVSMSGLRDDLINFIGDDTPEFWGDYAAFDYVVLSIIMGGFDQWPQGWPMHINDFQQDAIPSGTAEVAHHALSDARAMRDAWNHTFAGGHS